MMGRVLPLADSLPRITLPLGNHGARTETGATGPACLQLSPPPDSERAGLEHDGGQVPDRRFKGVIAGDCERVTHSRK